MGCKARPVRADTTRRAAPQRRRETGSGRGAGRGGDVPDCWRNKRNPYHPPQTLPQPGGYGAGLGLLVTRPAGTVSLTSAADADAGSIAGQDINVRLGAEPAGETGSVCFRASIR